MSNIKTFFDDLKHASERNLQKSDNKKEEHNFYRTCVSTNNFKKKTNVLHKTFVQYFVKKTTITGHNRSEKC